MTTATIRLTTPLPAVRNAPAKGFFARLLDAMVEARMRKAMREIAMYRHLIPADALKSAGFDPTATNDASLPFTR